MGDAPDLESIIETREEIVLSRDLVANRDSITVGYANRFDDLYFNILKGEQ